MSYKDIARRIGISPRTLHRWRQDAEFKKALELAVGELIGKVMETSGMVIEVNALSNSLVRDAELVNYAYMGERVDKLERDQSNLKEMLKDVVKVLKQLENDVTELRAILIVDSHEIKQGI